MLAEVGTSQDLFSIIVEGGRNPGEKPNQHAMLYSYFDDSSDARRQMYFACGGLVAREERWKHFHVPWAVATKDLEEPFRSADCEGRQRQFKLWDKPDCDRLMEKLVSILCDQELLGFAVIVPIPDYKAVFPSCGEYDPYYLAVKSAIIAMAGLGQDERDKFGLGGMECWFENSEATDGKTKQIYDDLRNLASWNLRNALSENFHFASKKLYQLQAADLLAREAFKYMKNRGTIPTRKPLLRMGDTLNFTVWTKRQLEYLRDHGGPDNLHLLTQWENTIDAPPFEIHWGIFR